MIAQQQQGKETAAMQDQHSSIWARTTTLQQCGIFLGIFAAVFVIILWVTK
jgi:hypothetical protein